MNPAMLLGRLAGLLGRSGGGRQAMAGIQIASGAADLIQRRKIANEQVEKQTPIGHLEPMAKNPLGIQASFRRLMDPSLGSVPASAVETTAANAGAAIKNLKRFGNTEAEQEAIGGSGEIIDEFGTRLADLIHKPLNPQSWMSVATAVYDARKAVHGFGDALTDEQQELKGFSSEIASSFQHEVLGQLKRDITKAQVIGPSHEALSKSVENSKDSMQHFNNAVTVFTNRGMTQLNNFGQAASQTTFALWNQLAPMTSFTAAIKDATDLEMARSRAIQLKNQNFGGMGLHEAITTDFFLSPSDFAAEANPTMDRAMKQAERRAEINSRRNPGAQP